MSLKILANTVWEDSAQLKVTDTSDAATTDTAGVENIAGGQRWQYWTSGSTADRRLAYINKNGGLACDYAVLTRADLHVGHEIEIHSWSNYTSSATAEYDSGSNFNPTLIGAKSQDYVWDLTSNAITGKQAMTMAFKSGGAGVYTKKVHQLYFASAFTLSFPGSISISRLRFPSQHLYDRQNYLVDEEWQFRAEQLSQADVDTFHALYMLQKRPLFIYDADGTLIPFKLLHCIIRDFQVVQEFDDHYSITISALMLRQWA